GGAGGAAPPPARRGPALRASRRVQFSLVRAAEEGGGVSPRRAEIPRQSYEAGAAKQKAGDATEIDVRLLLVAAQRADAALRSATAILEGDRKQLEAIVGALDIIRGRSGGVCPAPTRRSTSGNSSRTSPATTPRSSSP